MGRKSRAFINAGAYGRTLARSIVKLKFAWTSRTDVFYGTRPAFFFPLFLSVLHFYLFPSAAW